MTLSIVVNVKQVPDTQNVTGEAMTPEGTVNRGALPAIVNPEDLNALEEALRIRELHDATVTVLSMGPPRAVEALKACYFRGADNVVLLSDKKLAASDTLATSYALACAIRKIGAFDLVLCGRQAIDGDTAQVGPQLAEKLGINQITNVAEVRELTAAGVVVKRSTERGFEILHSCLPVLLTITGSANEPRSPGAKRLMGYNTADFDCDGRNQFQEWDVAAIDAAPDRCGQRGSPTRVKHVKSVVLAAGSLREVPDTPAGIGELIGTLRKDHIIG